MRGCGALKNSGSKQVGMEGMDVPVRERDALKCYQKDREAGRNGISPVGYEAFLQGLDYALARVPARYNGNPSRHCSTQEIRKGVRDAAIDRFGLFAPLVLEQAGLNSPEALEHCLRVAEACELAILKPEDRGAGAFAGYSVADVREAADGWLVRQRLDGELRIYPRGQ